MRYADLPANPTPNTVLRCEPCDADYSARRGDYLNFSLSDEAANKDAVCRCGTELVLVQRVRSYRKVKVAS